jgi:hypothetical protein
MRQLVNESPKSGFGRKDAIQQKLEPYRDLRRFWYRLLGDRKFQMLPGCGPLGGARLPDEAMEVFKERVVSAANAARAKTVVFGGLCLCAWKDEACFQAYLNGPDFPAVPPEEPY